MSGFQPIAGGIGRSWSSDHDDEELLHVSDTAAPARARQEALIERYGGTVLVIEDEAEYHVDGCRLLVDRDVLEDDVREVRLDGFVACSRCQPDRTLARAAAARAAERRASRSSASAGVDEQEVTPAVPTTRSEASDAPRPAWKRKRVLVPVALLGVLVVASAAGAGHEQPVDQLAATTAADSGVPSAVATTPVPTVSTPASTAPAASTPAATAPSGAVRTPEAPASSLAASGTSEGGSWTMPRLVGRDLQSAQDAIQEVTRDAVFFTTSHDASGRGRHQILDRDWQVCTQSVRPGAAFDASTVIDFGVVRVGVESC